MIKGHRGVTLVEILLVLAISGILLFVAYSLQLFGLQSFALGTSRAEMQNTARMIDEVIRSNSQIRNADVIGTSTEMQLKIELDKLYYGKTADARYISLPEGIDVEIIFEPEEDNLLKYLISVGTYEMSNRVFLNNVKENLSDPITLTSADGNNYTLYYKIPDQILCFVQEVCTMNSSLDEIADPDPYHYHWDDHFTFNAQIMDTNNEPINNLSMADFSFELFKGCPDEFEMIDMVNEDDNGSYVFYGKYDYYSSESNIEILVSVLGVQLHSNEAGGYYGVIVNFN